MIIELPDKKMTLEFPDDMPHDQITKIIQEQVYKAAPISPGTSPVFSTEDPTAASLGMFQIPEAVTPSMETLKNQLPLAGAMITAPFKATPILAPIAGMGASAGALLAGQGTEPMGPTNAGDITADSLNQFNAPLKPFAVGIGAQALAGPISKLFEKTITAPFAKYTEKSLAENALAKQGQELVEQGIQISPDLISPSRTSRALNWTLDNLWPANSIMASKRREVYNAAVAIKDEFAKKYGTGTTTKEATDAAWNNLFTNAGGENIVIPMAGTVNAIKESINKPFALLNDKWQKYFKTFIEEDALTLQGVRDLLTVAKPGKAIGAEKTAINQIVKEVENDFLTYDTIHGTNLAAGLSEARQASQKLARLQPIERILTQSITKPEGLEAGLFSPAQFIQKWEQIKSKVAGRMGSIDVKMVDSFALKLKAMIPDIKRIGEFEAKQNTPLLSGKGLQGAPGTMAGSVGLAVSSGGMYLLPMGAEVPLAYSIMNPTGLMRKWLTSGFKTPTLGTKIGLYKAGEELTND